MKKVVLVYTLEIEAISYNFYFDEMSSLFGANLYHLYVLVQNLGYLEGLAFSSQKFLEVRDHTAPHHTLLQ